MIQYQSVGFILASNLTIDATLRTCEMDRSLLTTSSGDSSIHLGWCELGPDVAHIIAKESQVSLQPCVLIAFIIDEHRSTYYYFELA
jgi:hypothetical protein